MKENILVVEDSKIIGSALKSLIINADFNCVLARSLKECSEKILEYKGKISVALLDLSLPDAPHGEVVDLVTKFKIPSIVLTGTYETDIEKKFRDKNIVDYIIKDSSFALEYSIFLIKRIISNKKVEALIVDDSPTFLEKAYNLFTRYQINALKATNGIEALEILKNNSKIKLILTDYEMPKMNGLELTKEIRKKYSKDELAIVVTSASNDDKISSKFLKYGANDYIVKNFTVEQFLTRINQNLENIEHFTIIKDKANKDYMTGMYNRRYLFDVGLEMYSRAKAKNEKLAVAIMDIDKFKNINDTYGHDVGDTVIKEVASILSSSLNEDTLISRMGGEEFCLVLKNRDSKEAYELFNNIREKFENNIILFENAKLKFTVSIGFTSSFGKTFEEMLKFSDDALYNAKESGRNKVIEYK